MKRLLSTRLSETAFSLGIFLLRASAGAMMIPHGYDKLKKFSEYAPKMIDPFHVGNNISLSLVIFAELFCAIFIILGLFTRFACIPLIINMAIALFYAHNGEIFGQGEHAALYLAIFLVLFIVGAGRYSIDRMIAK